MCTYLIPREIDREPFRLRGVWQPQIRGPVLDGELGRDLEAILLGLIGGEGACLPQGEGITASGGRERTWVCVRKQTKNNSTCIAFRQLGA